eukprot:GEMP01046660.1.p1 GENE.GEMP01046660.1~~GEMP01046660.1.p1  ORF type:complete len:270 (+),score=58.82 GEMP01046660.1:129-938(+)
MRFSVTKVLAVVVASGALKSLKTGNYLLSLALLAVAAAICFSHLISSYVQQEKSDFFQTTVKNTYESAVNEQPIESYNTLKLNLMEKVEALLGTDELESNWVEHLEPKQLQVLMIALRKRMHRNIQCRFQIEQDKPGQHKLWKHKLVSEEFWESLITAEKELSAEIEECMLEGDELRPNWRETLFNESLDIWRAERHRQMTLERQKEQAEEEKRAKEEEIRRLHQEQKHIEQVAKQKETMAAKLAASLAREEEQEAERAKKKNGGKKKK